MPFCYHSGSASCLFLVLFFACDSVSGFTGSHWTQPQTCLCCTVGTLAGVKGCLSRTPSAGSCPPGEDTPLCLRITPPGLRGRAEVVPSRLDWNGAYFFLWHSAPSYIRMDPAWLTTYEMSGKSPNTFLVQDCSIWKLSTSHYHGNHKDSTVDYNVRFFLLGWLCVINFCYIIFFLDSPEKAAVILAVSLTSPHLSFERRKPGRETGFLLWLFCGLLLAVWLWKTCFSLAWVSSCMAAAAGLGGWVKGLRNDSESFPAEKVCDSAVTSLSN